MRFVDLFWLVTPALRPGALQRALARPRGGRSASAASGSGSFVRQLEGRPLLPLHDPVIPGGCSERASTTSRRRGHERARRPSQRGRRGGPSASSALVLFAVGRHVDRPAAAPARSAGAPEPRARPARSPQLRPAGAAGAAAAGRPARRPATRCARASSAQLDGYGWVDRDAGTRAHPDRPRDGAARASGAEAAPR